jgi:acyl carrier protein
VSSVDDKVESTLAEMLALPRDRIDDDLAMKDVPAWDSLKHMELITGIEQAFGVELSFDEIVTMTSVGEIKRVIREKCAVS